MAIIRPECHLWGEKFSPSKLLEINPKLIMRLSNEPGEMGNTGKFKNLPQPHGACLIITPNEIENSKRIIWMADLIFQNKKLFIDAGATEIIYWIYWHGLQGNMEFSPEQIKKIGNLDIHLCIDYIQER